MSNIFNMADTWNAGGTTFTSILMNVTDTASAAASLLLDLQVGGLSKFKVDKGGNFTVTHAASLDCTLETTANSNAVFKFRTNGSNRGYVGWISSTFGFFDGSAASSFVSPSADLWEQRRGVNPQKLRIYNTYTDASNYERFNVEWSSNRVQLYTEKLGTGVSRGIDIISSSNLQFWTGLTQNWQITVPGHFVAVADNSFDIGASGSTRPRNVFVAGYVTLGSVATGSLPAAATAGAGAIIFDSTAGKLKVSTGSAWQTVTST